MYQRTMISWCVLGVALSLILTACSVGQGGKFRSQPENTSSVSVQQAIADAKDTQVPSELLEEYLSKNLFDAWQESLESIRLNLGDESILIDGISFDEVYSNGLSFMEEFQNYDTENPFSNREALERDGVMLDTISDQLDATDSAKVLQLYQDLVDRGLQPFASDDEFMSTDGVFYLAADGQKKDPRLDYCRQLSTENSIASKIGYATLAGGFALGCTASTLGAGAPECTAIAVTGFAAVSKRLANSITGGMAQCGQYNIPADTVSE